MGLMSVATTQSMCPAWNLVRILLMIMWMSMLLLHHNDVVGEAAEHADVRVGDTVAVVDGTDVQRANAELVQNLIA